MKSYELLKEQVRDLVLIINRKMPLVYFVFNTTWGRSLSGTTMWDRRKNLNIELEKMISNFGCHLPTLAKLPVLSVSVSISVQWQWYYLPFRAGHVSSMHGSNKASDPEKTPENNASFLLSVLWSSEALRDAHKAPARFHLPSACATAQSAPLYPHPADLPCPAVGHQGISSCHCLSDDGEFLKSITCFKIK